MITTERILEAVKGSGGYITGIANALKCSRMTIYRRMEAETEIQEAVKDEKEFQIDFVEGQLMGLIRGDVAFQNPDGTTAYRTPPNPTAIIFYLKTQGKGRGYVERQELTGADGKDIITDLSFVIVDSKEDE